MRLRAHPSASAAMSAFTTWTGRVTSARIVRHLAQVGRSDGGSLSEHHKQSLIASDGRGVNVGEKAGTALKITGTPMRVTLETPLTPNFIRMTGGSSVSIADLTDATLRAIGKSWTEALLKKARARRESPRG